MKSNFSISISYPPLESPKGIPFLSQNRQFQWTNTGNCLYPVIPAYAASALQTKGYKVYWDDAIAENLTYQQWIKKLKKNKPSLIVIESKTPAIKRHWQIIKDIKALKTKTWKPIVALMGDHVTALPEESLRQCPVDYVITGGDFDFMLLNLVDHLVNGSKLDPGFWFWSNNKYSASETVLSFTSHPSEELAQPARFQSAAGERLGDSPRSSGDNGRAKTKRSATKQPITGPSLGDGVKLKRNIVNTGPFALKHHNLDTLPPIDRQLTRWQLYAYNNTNYKYTPGSYLMSGRDCWWGKCTFCSWTTTHPFGTFRTFSVEHTLNEIGGLIDLGVKEIFDDSGTLPVGPWLKAFCEGMIDRGYHKKVVLGCNMRFAALNQDQYHLMKKAGFRFILYGLESSNQTTLDRIAKNTKVEDARKTLEMAKKAGLEPHLTIMIGYPWETKEDAQNTLTEARQLFKDGLADSMQATRIIPYPGTPLFKQCQEEGWLLTDDWDDYDMRQPVMKSPLSHQDQEELILNLFKGVLTPKFLIRKVTSIRSHHDVKHLANYAVKYLKKLRDFPALSYAKAKT